MEDAVIVPLTKDKVSVLVVIVNYRTAALVADCLRSLSVEIREQVHLALNVVVVDNDSKDNSVEYIQTMLDHEGWNDWATLVSADFNGGFSYGNNVAIRTALRGPNPPEYLYLLNPDTQIFPGAIRALVDFLTNQPSVGIVGSALSTEDGAPWPYAFRFPNILSELDRGMRLGLVTKLLNRWIVPQEMGDVATQVDWLPGASMMIRREVFDSVGLMDEDYFLYFEETDFCLQALRRGWQCWYVPQSQVMHVMGQSTGVTAQGGPPKRLPQYWFESRRRFFIKNYGVLYAACADLMWVFGCLTWRIRRIIQQKAEMEPPYVLQDFIQNSVLVGKGIRIQA